MTAHLFPSPRIERLGPLANVVATQVAAPTHAWVKEFVRAYLGEQFATRAIIRGVADRLTGEDDALIGVVLDVAFAGRNVLEPVDVRELLITTPRLPGLPVRAHEDLLERLGPDVLERYDRETGMRILRSLLHTVAKATARSIDVDRHTAESFALLLQVRNEPTIQEVTSRLSDPIADHLRAPILKLLPTLRTADQRDRMFAVTLLSYASISSQLSVQEISTTLAHAWNLGTLGSRRGVLEALRNPDLAERLPTMLADYIGRGIHAPESRLRAAAFRTLQYPWNREIIGNQVAPLLRRSLRQSRYVTGYAILDVVAAAGPEVLGADGPFLIRRHIDAWAAGTDERRQMLAITALERAEIRSVLGPVTTARIVARLQSSTHSDVIARSLAIRRHVAVYKRAEERPLVRRDPQVAADEGHHAFVDAAATMIEARPPGFRLPPAHAVRTWHDLDPYLDMKLDVAPTAAAIDDMRLDHHGLTVHVMYTTRELLENAAELRNCTKSWGPKVESGTTILVALRDDAGTTQYNADWKLGSGGWRLGDCRARFNATDVPPALRTQLNHLTAVLNAEWSWEMPQSPDPMTR